jgi:putative transposase
MSKDTTVIAFRQPEAIDDRLSELAREGARRMLAQVLIAEADSFVAMWKDLKLPDGRDRIVRHGHGPHRTIQTGVGPVEVRRAKVRDRGDVGAEEKSALPRRSCRSGCGGRRVSMRCCRSSTCMGFRRVTSRRC